MPPRPSNQPPASGMPPAGSACLAGSDVPELADVRVGYLPLTDCAPLVMAATLGLDQKHGVRIILSREPSWAGVRDKLAGGQLDLAHALYGLVYGVHLGIGGLRHAMAVLMTLDRNGQGITLSHRLAERGVTDLPALARLIRQGGHRPSFAQTFPTGTHALWLYYWLASAGIDPLTDCRIVTVPPPQMVAALQTGQIDGFSVGEPWNQAALRAGVGFTAATSQQVWPGHPEKVLAGSAAFVDGHPRTCRAVVAAVLEACRWLDASDNNKARAAEVIAQADLIDVPVDAILPRMLGRYEDGLGASWTDPEPMRFFADGDVNFPYLSDGMWFLTQYRRWGLLAEHPDYLGVARAVNRIGLYAEAAGAVGVALPAQPLRRSRLIDGVVWDGSDPVTYADSFAIRAGTRARQPLATSP